MSSGYERLVRHDASRDSSRELILGLALLAAVVLACLLAPTLPGEATTIRTERAAHAQAFADPQGDAATSLRWTGTR